MSDDVLAHGRRLKSLALLSTAVVAGLYLLSGTQDWFTLHLVSGPVEAAVVPGTVAVPAQSAFGLTALALVAALALAGPFFRIVFGVLGIVIALCVLLGVSLALGDPITAGAAVVSDHTGVSGPDSVAALVASVDTGWAPWLGVVAAVLGIAVSIAILVTARLWPGSGRRFEAERSVRGEDGAPVDWDALSRGIDPTDDR